jgi:hypothetical protein
VDWKNAAPFLFGQKRVRLNTTMESRINHLLLRLRNSEKLHTEVGLKIMKANGGAVYPVDLLAWAVINRSINLIQGFAILIEKRNFISAVPLLRLQIDNCLRFYAVYLVSDPHKFATNVLTGARIAKMKDESGARLTGGYLASRLTEHHSWVARVYDKTSGYIHLSESHIFNTFAPTRDADRAKNIQSISIGPGDNFLDEKFYEEATEAFIEATNVLFTYLVGWLKTKENPPERKRNGKRHGR